MPLTKLDEDTRKIITSILTSTPNQMNIGQLRRDYREMIGEDIPFKQLGHYSLEDYLKSIPDCVEVHGRGSNAFVEVIITKKSAHINKLISKQKITTNHKRRTVRRRNLAQVDWQHRDNTTRLHRLNIHKNVAENRPVNLPPEERHQPRCSTSFSEEDLEEGEIIDDEVNMEITNDLFKEIQSRAGSKIPLNVQKNLMQLVSEQKEGIWCAKIPTEYKNRFNDKFNYSDYGYNSLVQLCSDMGDVFHFVKPGKGDFKLYDKSIPIPLADFEKHGATIATNEQQVPKQRPTELAACALPDMTDIIEQHFSYKSPRDIVKYGDILEKQKISCYEPSQYIEINVAEIYDPSKFWFIVKTPECADKLNEIMDEMQIFYANSTEYFIPQYMIKVGMYCTAILYKEYHRAVIVSLVNNDPEYIKLFFIDYGSVATLPSKGICFLHTDFSTLPQQAIRARLAGIYPINTDSQWTRASARSFLNLVRNKTLVAQVHSVDEKRNALELILADTSTDEDVFINDMLVKEGHALFTYQEQIVTAPQFKPIVKYIHLFPTFDEIELGMVPSAGEMDLLRNMDLHLIYPQYYDLLSLRANKDAAHVDDDFHVRRPKDLVNVARARTPPAAENDDMLIESASGSDHLEAPPSPVPESVCPPSEETNKTFSCNGSYGSQSPLPGRWNIDMNTNMNLNLNANMNMNMHMHMNKNGMKKVHPPAGFYNMPPVYIGPPMYNNQMYYPSPFFGQNMPMPFQVNPNNYFLPCPRFAPSNLQPPPNLPHPSFLNVPPLMNHQYQHQSFLPTNFTPPLPPEIPALPNPPLPPDSPAPSPPASSSPPPAPKINFEYFPREKVRPLLSAEFAPEFVPPVAAKVAQNNQINSLNVALDMCDLNTEETSAALSPGGACYFKTMSNRFINIYDFRDDILHIIRHKNEKYLLMNEIMKKFIDEEMSILEIRRILARGHKVTLLSLDGKNNSDLKDEIERLKLMNQNESTIHLVLASDVPKLVRTFNKEFLDAEEYETFLLNIS